VFYSWEEGVYKEGSRFADEDDDGLYGHRIA